MKVCSTSSMFTGTCSVIICNDFKYTISITIYTQTVFDRPPMQRHRMFHGYHIYTRTYIYIYAYARMFAYYIYIYDPSIRILLCKTVNEYYALIYIRMTNLYSVYNDNRHVYIHVDVKLQYQILEI